MLNDKDKAELDTFPTLSECTEAILSVKKKSPELDGLPSEFYKPFLESLKENYYCTIKKTL